MNTWRRRRATDLVMTVLSYLAGAIAVFPLIAILWSIGAKALPYLGTYLFTESVHGAGGGLQNAILGTLLIVALALAVSAPIGILGGIYLAEFNRKGRFSHVVRFTADVLSGVPSIVIGYFGYIALVIGLGWNFSALAAGIALAVMSIPYILRASELAFLNVPNTMREAAFALGADKTSTIFQVLFRPALSGIVTGVLLAMSISLGETAPLIYTAGWSNFPPTGQLTGSPVGYLTYVIWTYINEPYAASHHLAYAAAFLLVVMILLINVVVRRVFGRTNVGFQRGG